MKRTALTITLICALFVSSLSVVQVVEVVKANVIPWPDTPNQDKPILTVKTPQNNTAYNANGVYLNFTVVAPDSWNEVYWVVHYIGYIHSLDVFLDGETIRYTYGGLGYCNDSRSFSIKLNQLTSGVHMLNVTVLGYTYYRGIVYSYSPVFSVIYTVNKYPIVVSDIVYFTVVGEPSSSPSPQQSEPEPFPTALFVAIAAAVAVPAGIIGFAVHRKRKSVL